MAFIVSKNLLKVETVKRLKNFVVIFSNSCWAVPVRNLSTLGKSKASSSSEPLTKNEDEILKSVFISQSNSVYTNLAIENWLYKNNDFNRHHVLLIWRNSPCVVIGRHQNPWLESNMRFLAKKGIDLARRNSGGGTVYHDRGNINLTFFSPRERYDRKYNLKIITKALKREWNLDVEISDKDDLLLNNCKVSGTASKLGRPNAYHHCTLLVDANKSNLKESLAVDREGFETNATKSLPSPIINLTDENHHISFERLLPVIGREYLRTTAISFEDGGNELMSRQRGFQLINPTDHWFPGLNNIRDELMSWDWRFARTPKFTVSRGFRVAEDSPNDQLRVVLQVEKGEITDVSFTVPECGTAVVESSFDFLGRLKGKKYSSQTFDVIEKSLRPVEREKEKRALRA